MGYLLAISLLVIIGTLCKEQCITVVGICLAYDFVFHFIVSPSIPHLMYHLAYILYKKFKENIYIGGMESLETIGSSIPCSRPDLRVISESSCPTHGFTTAAFHCVFFGLFSEVKAVLSEAMLQKPFFNPPIRFDNPAAYAPPQSRRLTHLYLVFVNLAFLFYPSALCADWTMGSIPLITSFSDPRNLSSLCTFAGLLVVALRCASPWTRPKEALALSMVKLWIRTV